MFKQLMLMVFFEEGLNHNFPEYKNFNGEKYFLERVDTSKKSLKKDGKKWKSWGHIKSYRVVKDSSKLYGLYIK